MEYLTQKEYKFISPDDLVKISKDKNIVLYDNNHYAKYRFPVHKYKNYNVLFCELEIDMDSNLVSIDIYDETGSIYPPFYQFCGNYTPLINKVNRKIKSELKRLNIEEV